MTPILDWQAIDTVLLDMDGTLLDRHFDDYFWEHYVPEHYALEHDLSIDEARLGLLGRYKGREGTLAWTDLDFWSNELGLDIPALKMKINHLIGVHPHVIAFLNFCREAGKKIYLVTNAHSKTLAIKMEKTALAGYFDRIICAEEVGMAKEDPVFWQGLETMLGYDKKRTMLADDTAKVLASARIYGMGFLIFVAQPSSRKPVAHSEDFPSVVTFKELIPETSKAKGTPMLEKERTELITVIGDFLEMGHVENIMAMFKQDTSLYALSGELLRDERFMVRMGMAVLFEELKGLRPQEVALAIPALLPILGEETPWMRGEAVNLLGIIGTPEALAHLKPLADDPEPQIREMVRDILAVS